MRTADPAGDLTVMLRGGGSLAIACGLVMLGMVFGGKNEELLVPACAIEAIGWQMVLLSDVRHAREYLGAMYRLQREQSAGRG